MEHANTFRFRGTCTTCYTRHAYLNADAVCLNCTVHASRFMSHVDDELLTDARLPPRRGWDIGVCIHCGFIRTCHDSICRECREQL